VALLDDLAAFSAEHRRCGMLYGGVEGARVWMTCDCGAALSRRVDEDEPPGKNSDRGRM